MAGLVVKPRARILHGHDWVFSSEVLKVFGSPADGDVISLKDGRDRLIGSAIYNSRSQIVARRFSRRKQDLDLDFFQRRLAQAIEYRHRRGLDLQLCRVVWSESDGLPGLIVDRYGATLVLQTLTLAMDQRKDLIVEALLSMKDLWGKGALAPEGGWSRGDLAPEESGPRSGGLQEIVDGRSDAITTVLERNDAPVRRAEGLELITGILHGPEPLPLECKIAGAMFAIDLQYGHKTGFYLDQVPNYAVVARHATSRRVLDCFTNQGAFALACASAGAAEVVAVEASAENLATAHENAARNHLQVRWLEDDVFQFLRAAEKAGEQFDLVILDPPSFTKGKGGLHDALRGYKELHVRAFKLLSKDGILATFSCSHHVTLEVFDEMIREALVDARRSARRLLRFEQALDHPVLPTLPETEYFKGMLLEMMPGR